MPLRLYCSRMAPWNGNFDTGVFYWFEFAWKTSKLAKPYWATSLVSDRALAYDCSGLAGPFATFYMVRPWRLCSVSGCSHFMRESAPLVVAFHLVLVVLLFGITGFLAVSVWRLVRESPDTERASRPTAEAIGD
jgi:hypothetical protein